MQKPPSFGKRGVVGAARTQAKFSPPPPRRWRSQTVVIGAISAIALGGIAASEWRSQECEPAKAEGAEPLTRPSWCNSHSGGHSGGGRGFYSSGESSGSHGGWFSGGSSSRASFGGFGSHGSGHGGG